MDKIELLQNKKRKIYTKRSIRIINHSVIILLALIFLSSAASGTVYRWIPSNGVTVAPGFTTNWNGCDSKPTSYAVTLLTDAAISGCEQDTWHDSGTLDPAIDLFSNTPYLVDTNVQGNWYYGRLKDTSEQLDIFTFRLIYVYPNGTIGVLPGTGGVTVGAPQDIYYYISLTDISGTVPAGAKLGLRISKTGISGMKIYFGDNVSQSSSSGYFSVTETSNSDQIPPVIILAGSSPVTVEAGSVYTDAGATASDNIDGDLTSSIVNGGLPVDTNVLGAHTVTYDVTDSSGNHAIQVTRIVNVVDTSVPVIALIGANPQEIEVGTAYTELGATVTDANDLGLVATIDSSTVDTSLVGTYYVTYDAEDPAGNHAIQVTRTVNVVDTTAPVITLVGSNPVTINIGTVYVDDGATASDNIDGDITSSIATVNPVDTSAVHTYIVTYNVNDSSNNPAVQVTRTVNVVYPCSPSFSDVACTHWAYSSIEYLKANGVTSGYPDLTFKPDNQITRAEIATFMVRARGLTYTGGETPFPDVPPSHWAYSFIMAAKQNGIVSGYPDGTFKPDNQVTRTEISVMVTRSRSWIYGGTMPDFTDVPTTFWGYPYIMASKEHGVIGGYPDGTFLPNNQASRAESSIMTENMMSRP